MYNGSRIVVARTRRSPDSGRDTVSLFFKLVANQQSRACHRQDLTVAAAVDGPRIVGFQIIGFDWRYVNVSLGAGGTASVLKDGSGWGAEGRQRYAAILVAAMRQVAAEPEGAFTKKRPDLRSGLRSFHIRYARSTPAAKVRRPVHVLYCRVAEKGDLKNVSANSIAIDSFGATRTSRHMPHGEGAYAEGWPDRGRRP